MSLIPTRFIDHRNAVRELLVFDMRDYHMTTMSQTIARVYNCDVTRAAINLSARDRIDVKQYPARSRIVVKSEHDPYLQQDPRPCR